jgi:phosphatidate cytidylyltransferase
MGAAGGAQTRAPGRRARRERGGRGGGGGGGGGGSELAARLIVAAPAIAYAIAIIAGGGYWFALGILPLAIIAVGELFDMYADAEPVRLAGFVGVTALILAAYLGDGFHVLLTFVAFFPVLFAVTLVQRRAGTLGMAITVFGVAWVGIALAHGVLLRGLPHGGGIIVDILVGTFIGDSGAYIGGRWFGRRKLAPSVSPNKTVEGLAIGMLAALLATWLAGTYQDWLSGTDALLLGVGVGLAAPAGDLFESFVKRDAGTKDSGSLFGAHGGALDRLDAVFFTAVVGYYLWLVLL